MLRKYDRILGTLIIWIAILFSMYFLLGAFTYPRVSSQNVWYWPGNVVVSSDPDAANKAMQSLNAVSDKLYWTVDSFTRNELLAYWPALLVIAVILLAGGLVGTYFIWRHARLPELNSQTEDQLAFKLKNQKPLRRAAQSAEESGFALGEDGEIIQRSRTSRS